LALASFPVLSGSSESDTRDLGDELVIAAHTRMLDVDQFQLLILNNRGCLYLVDSLSNSDAQDANQHASQDEMWAFINHNQ
jgi:hypothetical protein